MMFPEYSTFEKDELGYDPCELLTMKAVTQTCKPTSTVSIYNKRQDPRKYVYSGMGQMVNYAKSSLQFWHIVCHTKN
jgi:hypothetical protein